MPTPNNSPDRRALRKMAELAKKKARLERSYRKPPVSPKSPKPPGGAGWGGKFGGKALNVLAKGSWVLTGLQLGNWAGNKVNRMDGSTINIVTEYQEQEAIREFEAIRERTQREIQPAKYPYEGGQVANKRYLVKIGIKVQEYTSRYWSWFPNDPEYPQYYSFNGKFSVEKLYETDGRWRGVRIRDPLFTSYTETASINTGSSSARWVIDYQLIIIREDGTSKENDVLQGGNPTPIVNNIVNNYPLTIVNYPPPVPFNDGELRFELTKHIGELNNKLLNEFNLNFREMRERLINLSNKAYEGNKEKIEEPPPPLIVERPPIVILEPVPVNYTENKAESHYQKKLELMQNQQGPSFSSKTSTTTNSQGETATKTTLENKKTGETAKLTIPPPIIAPTPTEKPQRTTNITQNQTPPATCRTGCTGAILDSLDGVSSRQLQANNALQLADLGLLQVINNKLGNQLPGGISGFFRKAWESTALDKAINALNLFLTLHNAAMLSRNLAESIDVLVGNALSLVGIKNHEGSPIDFSAILGKATTAYLKSLIGEETYNGINTNWQKLNTIYQSAVNILDNVQNIQSGISEGLETVGEMTGKIGNELKRAGVIFEDGYNWFAEKFSFKSGRFAQIQKVIDGIQTAQEVTDNLTSVVSNVQEITESVGQITTEISNIKKTIKDDGEAKKAENDEAEEASTSPVISNNDKVSPREV